MRVAAAVLAAGRGTRLGRSPSRRSVPKPMLELHGRPLVAWALDAVMSTELRPAVLVVGYRGGVVQDAAPAGVIAVRALAWRRGIAHSLRAALRAVDGWAQTTALCVGLADQPLVGAEAYRRLAAAHTDGAELAVATYDGERSHPVLIGRSLWPTALRLRGDIGARTLMATHEVVEVDCTGTGNPRDVDTFADLHALEEAIGT